MANSELYSCHRAGLQELARLVWKQLCPGSNSPERNDQNNIAIKMAEDRGDSCVLKKVLIAINSQLRFQRMLSFRQTS